MDLLSQAGLFCERCLLENRVSLQYGEVITDLEEKSERFVPGWGL